MQSETLRVHVINAKFSALNFTSMKFVVAELRLKRCEVYANSAKLSTRMSPNFVVAKLSSQTLRKSSSFRTLRKLHELCEAFKSNYTSRCAVHSGLHYDFSYALSASDIASPSPEYRWSQSCLAIFGELRILLLHAFFQLSESSSSFEIRHSNDPNTPRGIHLYFGSSYKHCQHDLADH